MRKKILTLAVATMAASSILTGCGSSTSSDKKAAADENITAVSREDGSEQEELSSNYSELKKKIKMEIK